MKPKVKFCGMTREADIEAAEALAVDFLGFIFVPSSPRYVTLEHAETLKKHIQKAQLVGVFEEQSQTEMEKHIHMLHLDYVQLYGRQDDGFLKNISVPVIQAFRGIPDIKNLESALHHCAYVLIDKAEGENEVDFDAAAQLPLHIRSKLFFAGGLTPGNVRVAADRIQPFAVDCARGIESSPGEKNHHRMSAFLHALSS
ncbi:MAG: phosphoribosylanthranilate isomerase [Candidatus Peregrinibacteria bacterium]|nr:phosphoribosylanthranilate isomerase [Candidatus Peregrinibacteria bacterium]